MKYLIAGLGNPGADYDNTRHNIGFKVLDFLAAEMGVSFSSDRLADVCMAKYKGRSLYFIKPNTFMNLSGKAVRYWMQQEKIPVSNLLVIVDDLSLPLGKIRLRKKGGDGGHNGLKDIENCLDTKEYARLRYGIGNDFPKGRQVEFVLGKWSKEEEVILEERNQIAVDFVKSFVSIGVDRTMSQLNNS
ncbi:MAG: aminoacyl-tRNA hydrolase [Chitinophagaceae bacterium]|nr:MAG: aminoacyl-tRNA hydrolase [Chitinophagaceae bacterium]